MTVQEVLDGARATSIANKAGLGPLTTREILERANFAQQELHTRLAQENRYFYAVKATPPSSAGGPGGRTVDLSTLNPKCERILVAYLPSGTEMNGVDVEDQDADLAPRYYQLGETLYEVKTDWSLTAGIITLTLYHVTRPAELTLTASDLSQSLTIPDRFARYYELDLALYLAQKDWARAKADPGELQRFSDDKESVYQTMLTYLDHFSGATRRRFDLPVPTTTEKA